MVATPPHNIAYSVVRYAKERNIPVIVDVRDQWPDIFMPEKPHFARKLMRFLLSRDFAQMRAAFKRSDSITAVSRDFLEWGLSYAGRERSSEDKVFYIGTKLAEKVVPDGIGGRLRKMVEKARGKTKFLFVGSFGKMQNPLIIVEVAKRSKEANRPAFFILAGDGEYMEKVRKEAAGLENVIITGWLKHDEIMYLLDNVDVGMCPLNRKMPLFPNKAFMYFSAGLPVISAAGGELRELISEKRIGLNYEPNDISGLRDKISIMNEDPALVSEMGRNVESCFSEIFDAGTIYEKFCDHIENIAGVRNNQRD
jgi:glycosyltransferase involved in cell wall biosynthesis